MDYKPSLRNIIATAQEYLTFVENCPPFGAVTGVTQNADLIRQQINAYNNEVAAGKGKGSGQLPFEDKYAKQLMQALTSSRAMVYSASVNPNLKNYVVDGGGSEWNRVNPVKLSNQLRDLVSAESRGVSRAASTYHSEGSIEYEAKGSVGVLKVRNADDTLSRANLKTAPKPGLKPAV
jgi:hypothetical protein